MAVEPYIFAAIGSVACMLTLLLHHPSTSLVVVGGAMLATLALVDGSISLARGWNAAVFVIAYLVTRPGAWKVPGGWVGWGAGGGVVGGAYEAHSCSPPGSPPALPPSLLRNPPA